MIMISSVFHELIIPTIKLKSQKYINNPETWFLNFFFLKWDKFNFNADGINLVSFFSENMLYERDNIELRIVNYIFYIFYDNGKPIWEFMLEVFN